MTANLQSLTDADVWRISKSSPAVGAGCSRMVYDLGDAVLKVDKAYTPTGGCNAEASFWAHADASVRELLAPVLASGDGWLVMARCEPWENEFPRYRFQELREELEIYGVTDLGSQNVMSFNGRLVAVDYACSRYNPDLSICSCSLCQEG